ncbi:minor tail protein [Mycobacterium phage Leopard]|nr:minor tail protein [Mycobacterium phage Leopard]WKW85202.1 minor tail protein [Mycobacterium phage Aikoy]
MSINNFFGEYQSQTTRQLAQISSSKYPDTNKDFEANVRRLNAFVDYIAQYLGTMQKGIDQANADVIKRIRDMAADLVVLLGGGELLYGIDLGDLQYFLPALGALFGFDKDTPFPINLFEAAQRFLLGYVVPLDAFGYAVVDIINGWAVALGLNEEFVAALNEVMEELIMLGSSFGEVFDNLWDLFDIIGINTDGLGPFADLWHVITQLLGSFGLEQLGQLTDPIFEAVAPWVKELAELLELVNSIVKAFSGGLTDVQGILNFAQMFTPFIDFMSTAFDPGPAWAEIILQVINPSGLVEAVASGIGGIIDLIGIGQITDFVLNLLPNPNFLDLNAISEGGGIWTVVKDIVHDTGGSATAACNGTLRELLSDPPTKVRPGETLDVTSWLRWTGVTATPGLPAFALGLNVYDANNVIIDQPNLQTITNPPAASSNVGHNNFIKLSGSYEVPDNASYSRQRFTITEYALTGVTWWGDASLGKSQLLDVDWVAGLGAILGDLADGITGALSALADKLDIDEWDDWLVGQWQGLLNGIKGGPGGAIADLINRLTHIDSSGKFDASQLFNMAGFPTLDPSKVSGLPDLANNVVSGFKGIFDAWFGSSSGTGSPAEVAQTIEAIKDAVISGYTVTTFTSSQTNWARPSNITEMIAVVVGGGQNGQNGINNDGTVVRPGGLHGSYLAQNLDVTTLPAAFDIAVGTAGQKSYVRVANGSHTGAVVVESPAHGSAGGIATAFGLSQTNSAPGNGGAGGMAYNSTEGEAHSNTPGATGGSSGLAAGGSGGSAAPGGSNAGANGGNGGAGGTVSAGALTKCGGGGGGGGGGARSFAFTGGTGGSGGPGGYPGGGGGSGGNATNVLGGTAGSAGAGAAGVVWLFYR